MIFRNQEEARDFLLRADEGRFYMNSVDAALGEVLRNDDSLLTPDQLEGVLDRITTEMVGREFNDTEQVRRFVVRWATNLFKNRRRSVAGRKASGKFAPEAVEHTRPATVPQPGKRLTPEESQARHIDTIVIAGALRSCENEQQEREVKAAVMVVNQGMSDERGAQILGVECVHFVVLWKAGLARLRHAVETRRLDK